MITLAFALQLNIWIFFLTIVPHWSTCWLFLFSFQSLSFAATSFLQDSTISLCTEPLEINLPKKFCKEGISKPSKSNLRFSDPHWVQLSLQHLQYWWSISINIQNIIKKNLSTWHFFWHLTDWAHLTPGRGLENPGSQVIHLNRLSGGAGVRHQIPFLYQPSLIHWRVKTEPILMNNIWAESC